MERLASAAGSEELVSDDDWVGYNSIGRSGGVLTGAVAGNLLRRVTSTYHNAAADADEGLTNPADSTAAYWHANAPRNLRAVKRSETAT